MMRGCLFALLFLPLVGRAGDALLESWNSSIASLESRVARDPEDFIAWNFLVDRYLRRERWTGDLEDLRRAAQAAARSLKAVPAEVNIGGLVATARVALAQHRFADARAIAEKLRDAQPGKSLPYQLLGDAQMELGDLDAAARAYEEMERLDGSTVGTEFRMARLAMMRGELEDARKHLETTRKLAEDTAPPAVDLTAWARVQLGEFMFKHGDFDAAEVEYQSASRLAPQHWSVLEHLAELEAARGHDAKALELYERALHAAPRPELWQMLGDYHLFMKRPAEAAQCHESALAGYRASIDRGEVIYYHHLAGLYADSLNEPEKAVEWAGKDLALRQSIYAWDALAWAEYRNGNFAEARKASGEAMRTGIKDAHILYHTAMIRMSSGDIAGGKSALQATMSANARYNSFHVHR